MGEERLMRLVIIISIGLLISSVCLAIVGKYVSSVISLISGLGLLSYASRGREES